MISLEFDFSFAEKKKYTEHDKCLLSISFSVEMSHQARYLLQISTRY